MPGGRQADKSDRSDRFWPGREATMRLAMNGISAARCHCGREQRLSAPRRRYNCVLGGRDCCKRMSVSDV